MKAVVARGFEPFDTVTVEEMPDPVPGPGEIVLAVEASEVNYPDILQIEGKYQIRAPRPFVPGLGAVGRVIAVGPDVGTFRLGQRALALPGGTTGGAFAEKIKAHERFCFDVPGDIPAEVAAALGLAYQTSYTSLLQCASFRPGDNVLVLGATGGIGMAAMQIARALGAKMVIAGTRGEAGVQVAREMGADHVIDCAREPLRDLLRDEVLDATDGQGADVVIDPVGGAIGEAALRAMAWHGRYVVVGFTSGEAPTFKGNYLLIKGITVTGMQWTEYQDRRLAQVRTDQEAMFQLWRDGKMTPHISHRFPLTRVVEALTLVSRGMARGKIILLPDPAEAG